MKKNVKRSEWDAHEVAEWRTLRDAEDYLRSAQGFLAHALSSLGEKNKKAVHHSMARVKECLHEVSWRLRGCKLKNGARA